MDKKSLQCAPSLSTHTQTPDEDNVLTVNGLKCKNMINARCQSHLPPGGNPYEKQAFPQLSKGIKHSKHCNPGVFKKSCSPVIE